MSSCFIYWHRALLGSTGPFFSSSLFACTTNSWNSIFLITTSYYMPEEKKTYFTVFLYDEIFIILTDCLIILWQLQAHLKSQWFVKSIVEHLSKHRIRLQTSWAQSVMQHDLYRLRNNFFHVFLMGLIEEIIACWKSAGISSRIERSIKRLKSQESAAAGDQTCL